MSVELWLWITGSLVVLLSLVNLRVARNNVATARQLSDPRMCSCGHPYSKHTVQTRGCRAQELRKNYLKNGSRNGKKWVECDCLHFDGTAPIDVLSWEPPK